MGRVRVGVAELGLRPVPVRVSRLGSPAVGVCSPVCCVPFCPRSVVCSGVIVSLCRVFAFGPF